MRKVPSSILYLVSCPRKSALHNARFRVYRAIAFADAMSPKLPPMHLEPIARALQPRNLSRFQCLRQVRSASQTRYLSQSPIFSNLAYQDEPPLPRWAYTPKSMTAPVSLKKRRPNNNWKVNENPKDLDDFYTSLLGEGGDTLLPDEIKWLAVTHKSFDQGRRGYNDRLAFLG